MTDFDFDMDKKRKEENENENENGDNEECSDSLKRKQLDNAQKSKRSCKKKNDESEDENDLGGEDLDKNGLTSTIYTAKPINLQPGHTSYLTFATLLHKKYLNN